MKSDKMEVPGSFKRVALNYQAIYRVSTNERSPCGTGQGCGPGWERGPLLLFVLGVASTSPRPASHLPRPKCDSTLTQRLTISLPLWLPQQGVPQRTGVARSDRKG